MWCIVWMFLSQAKCPAAVGGELCRVPRQPSCASFWWCLVVVAALLMDCSSQQSRKAPWINKQWASVGCRHRSSRCNVRSTTWRHELPRPVSEWLSEWVRVPKNYTYENNLNSHWIGNLLANKLQLSLACWQVASSWVIPETSRFLWHIAKDYIKIVFDIILPNSIDDIFPVKSCLWDVFAPHWFFPS